MCNKCIIHHNSIFENQKTYDINWDIKEIFTGFYKEENHQNQLYYFCKTHNKLWCATYLCKIKERGNRIKCDVC